MNSFNKTSIVSDFPKKEVFRLPSERLIDKSQVQLGGQGPAFRKILIADKGNVPPWWSKS